MTGSADEGIKYGFEAWNASCKGKLCKNVTTEGGLQDLKFIFVPFLIFAKPEISCNGGL